jgi:hypothetical protein
MSDALPARPRNEEFAALMAKFRRPDADFDIATNRPLGPEPEEETE